VNQGINSTVYALQSLQNFALSSYLLYNKNISDTPFLLFFKTGKLPLVKNINNNYIGYITIITGSMKYFTGLHNEHGVPENSV